MPIKGLEPESGHAAFPDEKPSVGGLNWIPAMNINIVMPEPGGPNLIQSSWLAADIAFVGSWVLIRPRPGKTIEPISSFPIRRFVFELLEIDTSAALQA